MAKTSARKGEITGDLGRLLAEVRSKAEGWLGQRESISKHLEGIRDAANELLRQLGHQAPAGQRKAGRAVGAPKVRRRRKLSAAGRAAIVAAQKARWARVRAAKK